MIYPSHLSSSFVLTLYYFVFSSLHPFSPSLSFAGVLSPSEPIEVPTYIPLPSRKDKMYLLLGPLSPKLPTLLE